jgi:choline dehydrogenase-like flavoprotein
LYVADASVFPSASGVNPMVTTMTFGEWIGRRVVEEMVEEARGKPERGAHHL